MEIANRIMEQIREKVDNNTQTPQELTRTARDYGLTIFMTRNMTEEQLVTFCSSLIKLYERLKEQ